MRRYSSTAQATTLSAGCTSSATSIQVTATTGFPAVDFILALDYGAAGQELVLVTNVAGTTLTVTRGYNSTPAAAHSLGAVVRHVHAAIDFTDSRTHEAATSAVHGLAGTVVGTTDVQALSNKDLSSGTNTFPAALATDAEVTSAVSTHAALTVTHGATGALVGTTNAQTLTTKTIALGSNTVSGTTAQFNTALTDNDFATLAGAETLTNKTLTAPTITAPVIDTLAGVTGVGQVRHLRRTADQTFSTTVLANDDTLAFSVVANGVYELTIGTVYTGTLSGKKVYVGLSIPAGATWNGVSSGSVDAIVGATTQTLAVGLDNSGAVNGTAVSLLVLVGGTAGSATVQWAKESGSATIKLGTWATIRRVA